MGGSRISRKKRYVTLEWPPNRSITYFCRCASSRQSRTSQPNRGRQTPVGRWSPPLSSPLPPHSRWGGKGSDEPDQRTRRIVARPTLPSFRSLFPSLVRCPRPSQRRPSEWSGSILASLTRPATIITIKLYFNNAKSGTAAPFTGVYKRWDKTNTLISEGRMKKYNIIFFIKLEKIK